VLAPPDRGLDLNQLYSDCRRELEIFVRRSRPHAAGSLESDQVQDAIQEAFKILLEHARSPTPPWRDPRAYLFGVCLRVAAGFHRDRDRQLRWMDAAALGQADASDSGAAEDVDPGFEQLGAMLMTWMERQPEAARTFLYERYVERVSLRSSAARTGQTVWSVRALEQRLLRGLLATLASGANGDAQDLSWAKAILKRKLRTKATAAERTNRTRQQDPGVDDVQCKEIQE
jgi:DNA-directed RNA polymerase specialized sigma24 family protein